MVHPELIVRSLLHRAGYRFTVNGPNNKKLPGRSRSEHNKWGRTSGVRSECSTFSADGIRLKIHEK
jgi:hypothetical protein